MPDVTQATRIELLEMLDVMRQYQDGERVLNQAIRECLPQFKVSAFRVELDAIGYPEA